MKIRIMGFGIFLLTVLSFAAIANSPTKIIIFRPFNQKGLLDEKLIVTQRASGSCWTTSLANSGRFGAWRCLSNNLIMDPCFQDSNTVACIVAPWSNKVSVLELTTPLPQIPHKEINTSALPWALELQNGQRCIFITGTASFIQGKRINYGCDDHYGIVGDLDRSTPSWKVHFYNYDNNTLKDVTITKAWF